MSECDGKWFARFVFDKDLCRGGRVRWRTFLDKRPPHDTSGDLHEVYADDIHWGEGKMVNPAKTLLGAADISVEGVRACSLDVSVTPATIEEFRHHAVICGWPVDDSDEAKSKRMELAQELADRAKFVERPTPVSIAGSNGVTTR